MKARKAQTAIELLTVYGWVVLLILVVFIVAYYSGYLDFKNVLPQYCSITPTMSCSTYKFGFMPDGKTMTLLYKVVNGVGYDIYFSNSSVSLTVDNIGKAGKNVYNGTCYPNSVPIRPGNPISCIVMISDTDVVPAVGKNLDFSLSMKYRNCEASESYKINRNCSTAPEYTIGGAIRAQLEPKGASLFGCGDEICEYVLGENPDNCCGDCPVYNLTLEVDPTQVGTNGITTLTAHATYPDGTAAADATILFNKSQFNPDDDYLEPFSDITNASGYATSYFSSNATGLKNLTATTCGASASVNVMVIPGAPIGAIIFSKSPDSVGVGGTYNINVTVYNSSGSPEIGDTVYLISDADSTVTPNATQCSTLPTPANCITDINGTLQSNFSSNVLHVGTLRAKSNTLGIVNWTHPAFEPPQGRLLLWITGATGQVGSEGYVQISGCLYDLNGQSISDATLNLTTDLGYFITDTGTPKLPNLPVFYTRRPVCMRCARTTNNPPIPIEPLATSGVWTPDGDSIPADPVEIDEYGGKFVKVMMTSDTYANSSTKSKGIAEYLRVKGTDGRRVYIFYNSSYNLSNGLVSWVYPRELFGNLTIDLPANAGIPQCTSDAQTDCFKSVSDWRELYYIMLSKANTTILINANEMFPIEIWKCESNPRGGIPRKFFQRGGIEIHTGDIEYYYGVDSTAQDPNKLYYCGWNGPDYVFGNWKDDTYTSWAISATPVYPVRTDKSVLVRTYVDGCFDYTTSNSILYSTQTGTANITATYYSVSNSSTVSFTGIPCNDSGTIFQNGTCRSQGSSVMYCINGFKIDRCGICDVNCISASGKKCDWDSGSCVDPPGPVILTVKSFNGTGKWLPNDNYSLIEVIAQVLDGSGNLLDNVPVTWEVGSYSAPDYTLEIVSVPCARTGAGCGDSSALPTPTSPRAVVFVKSNMSGSLHLTNYLAYVNATATVYGQSVPNSTNITVNDSNVISTRWRQVSPTVLPADSYTESTICLSTFNFNDSALGNVSVRFNTTRGTFNNSQTNQSLTTDPYGQVCAYLKSGTGGTANVSLNVTNWNGNSFITYLYKNITFYPLPSSIIITPPNPTATPCFKCTSGWLRINATLKNGTNPIAGVPYVYFTVPYQGYTGTLLWYNTGWYDWYYEYGPASQNITKLKPGYIQSATACNSISDTNNTCSNSTDSSGLTSTTFGPVYPPGWYKINVSVWYNCDGEPFSPLNCHKSFSNATLINVTPVQMAYTVSQSPTRLIQPDYTDSVNLTMNIYGSNGSVLPNVWCRLYFTGTGAVVPSPSELDPYTYPKTDSNGNCYLNNVKSHFAGNFTVRARSTYYYQSGSNILYNSTYNDTIIKFTMIGSVTFNKSSDFVYGDGSTCPNVTITVRNVSNGPMSNLLVNINPLTIGSDTGVISCPPPGWLGTDGSCNGVYTDSQGRIDITACSSKSGTANFSVSIPFGAATYVGYFVNWTNINFVEPPQSATMTINTTSILGDGVDRALFTTQFTNSTGPTPGVSVVCSISENAVFYPFSNLVTDLNGNVKMNVSANQTPQASLMCWHVAMPDNIVATKSVDVTTPAQGGKYFINVIAYPDETIRNAWSTVNATVKNSTGQVQVGIQVNFSTSWGGTLNDTNASTDSGGNARVNATMSTDGSIFVKASITSAMGTDFGTVKIKYDP
ncbi:MAG: hypothetical protein NT130_05770 [Candidatus Micrarchaeota archaeon]|nr:hypothetical protein [Candidatus Micrarchaeota archaeon]